MALGEATHGNKEFQQLKLDIFKIMVEDYGVRAFSLEGDYGGCEAVNRYIHGGDGTVKDAVSAIGFAIYQTEEMENLISWMREYNKSASLGNDIRFYGFDMQRREYNYQYLLEAVKNAGMDAEELEKIWNQDKLEYTDGYTPEQREKIIEDVKREFEEKDTLQNASAVHLDCNPVFHGNVVSVNQMIGIMMGSIAVFGIIYYFVTLLPEGEGGR